MKVSLMPGLIKDEWILISASASFADTYDEYQMTMQLKTKGECYWFPSCFKTPPKVNK